MEGSRGPGLYGVDPRLDAEIEEFERRNMGRTCAYCTLWAGGFVGLLPHLERRAGFGPGDDFCAACSLLDLLRDGAQGWVPRL